MHLKSEKSKNMNDRENKLEGIPILYSLDEFKQNFKYLWRLEGLEVTSLKFGPETKKCLFQFWCHGALVLALMRSHKKLLGDFGQCDVFDKVWFQPFALKGKDWNFIINFFIDLWVLDGLMTIFLENQASVLQTSKFVQGVKLARFWKLFWECLPMGSC